MTARTPLGLYVLATLPPPTLSVTGARERTEGPAELPYHVIETTFTSDDATLPGTLTLPSTDGPLRWHADHLTFPSTRSEPRCERSPAPNGRSHAFLSHPPARS